MKINPCDGCVVMLDHISEARQGIRKGFKHKRNKTAMRDNDDFIKTQPDIACILRKRKTALEPIFDLIAKLLGTSGKQKSLFRQDIENVRTHLALGRGVVLANCDDG